MPKYAAVLALLQASVLLIPESVWTASGLEVATYSENFPHFMQYHINATDFKNVVAIFWLLSPITLLVCAVLWIAHINKPEGYQRYLQRRAVRLKAKGRAVDYPLMLGVAAMLALYGWGTLFSPGPVSFFNPTESRLAMLLVYGGGIGLMLPVFLAFLITELRATIFPEY
jgi:hypothetical protein